MVNSRKLKAKIMESGLTQSSVAEEIGISRNSIGRKINGSAEFTLGEVVSICKLLHIQDPREIFLSDLSQICNERDTA